MNITKQQLKQIIKEEIEVVFSENYIDEEFLTELENDPSETVTCTEFLQRESIAEKSRQKQIRWFKREGS